MKFEKSLGLKVVVIDDLKTIGTSETVEANLLFAILEKLEEIRCGLIDIENQASLNWKGE